MPTSSKAMCRIYALRQCYKNLKIKSSLFFGKIYGSFQSWSPATCRNAKRKKNTKHLTTMGQASTPVNVVWGKVRQCMHFLMKFLGWSKIILVWISPCPQVSLSLCLWNKGCRPIEYSIPHWPEYTTMRLCFTRHFRWVPPGFTNEASWEVDISQRLKKQGPCISSMITLQ